MSSCGKGLLEISQKILNVIQIVIRTLVDFKLRVHVCRYDCVCTYIHIVVRVCMYICIYL